MKKIIAKDKEHLRTLIQEAIEKNGNDCNLNHIDVSNITDMTYMFGDSQFNGDINGWRLLSVQQKDSMFKDSILEKNNKIPYWYNIEPEFMQSAINSYELHKKMNQELNSKEINKKPGVKI